MKTNRALAGILLAAIVAALATELVIEHQARLKLATEHHLLEQQSARMAELAAQSQQLSNRLAQAGVTERLPPTEFTELLRLRGEVGMLRQQKPDFDMAREENRQIHTALDACLNKLNGTKAMAAADRWPQSAWTNSGHGNPEAALQTALWAGNNGDLTNLLASFTGDRKKEIADDVQKKSAAEVSARIADETYDLNSIRILGREIADANTVVLTVELEGQDDFRTVKMVMINTGDGWKFAGPKK